jgi:ParB family chromosome partitioning protein
MSEEKIKRTSAPTLDPESIGIPGYDDWLADHCQSEGKDRLEEDESMIKNIIFQGIIQPVVISIEGDKSIVVAGRRRVFNCRAANRILDERGEPLRKVPYMIRRGDEKTLLGISAAENVIRRDLTTLQKAKKIEQMMNFGATEEEVAVTFGSSAFLVQWHLKLLELDKRVLELVETEEVSPSAALEVHGLPLNEQYEAILRVMAGGKPVASKVKEEVTGRLSPPTKKRVKSLVEYCKNKEDSPVSGEFLDGVLWAKGMLDTEDVRFAGFKELLNTLKKAPVKKNA